MVRYVLLPILILSLLIAVFYSMSVVRGPEAGPSPDGLADGENASFMRSVEVVRTSGSRVDWRLRSEKVNVPDSIDEGLVFDAPEVTLPSEEFTVRAPRGSYETLSGDITFGGGAIIAGRGYNVRARDMRLDAKSGVVASDDNVTIDGQWGIITGQGMTASSGQVRVLGDVKSVFY